MSARQDALLLLPFAGVFLTLVWFFGWSWEINLKQLFFLSKIDLLLSIVICASYGTILYSIVSLLFPDKAGDRETQVPSQRPDGES